MLGRVVQKDKEKEALVGSKPLFTGPENVTATLYGTRQEENCFERDWPKGMSPNFSGISV